MNEDRGYDISKLPIFNENLPEDAPDVVRILKSRGELANISYDQEINYIAYVEFPLDGVPRGNHYHEKKLEYMYLISGKIKGYFQKANTPKATIFEEIIEAGSLIKIQPGWIHAYTTLEPGHAIEYSTSGLDIVSKDKIRSPIVE